MTGRGHGAHNGAAMDGGAGVAQGRGERPDGLLDRKQIDGLSAFARMMERWETLARERAEQEEVARDEDVAESLRLIDERIPELALVEARRMVAAGTVAPDA